MRVTFRQVTRSAGLYPITSLYVGACVLAVSATRGLIGFAFGLAVLAGLTVVSLVVATWRENRLRRTGSDVYRGLHEGNTDET